MANGKTNVTNNFGEQSTQYLKPVGTSGPAMVLPGGGGFYAGTGAPAFACAAGSIYVRTNGANANQVLYTNFDGQAGSWAPMTGA